MLKNKTNLILILIILLAFFAVNLSFPDFYNKSADYINSKTGMKIPHFWQKPYKLGLDLQGGIYLVYEADLSGIDKTSASSVMGGLRDIIEKRINYYGIQEPIVQVQEGQGNPRLIVELAGVKDPAEAIKLIGQTPFLEFRKQKTEEETKKILEKRKEVEGKKPEEIEKIADWQMALQDPYFESTNLTGKYLAKSEIGFEQNTQKSMILLQFNDEGAKLFEELTAQNVGKQLAIYIDEVLISAPRVNEKIAGGRAQITGDFTVKEAQDLVKNLNAGSLPIPIKIISQQVVGPTLGAVSLEQSLKAGIYGFLAVVLFMILIYRLPGLLASLALVIYVALVLSLFKLIPVTLTLAGIGGFILSIGMAVDANILIFARMKEEIKQGKSLSLAIQEGFKRAWPSIRDSNFNSLIVCAILFLVATSFIKGFALTLGLGILMSMFSAIFITRILLLFFIRQRMEKFKWLL